MADSYPPGHVFQEFTFPPNAPFYKCVKCGEEAYDWNQLDDHFANGCPSDNNANSTGASGTTVPGNATVNTPAADATVPGEANTTGTGLQ